MKDYIKPKKSLGQNFLTSESALQKIADAARITGETVILEVGPGKGALTRYLLSKKPKKIHAIEKDSELIPFLAENFKKDTEGGILSLENKDIMEFVPETHPLLKNGYIIVANIPYYITGHFIRKFLTCENKPQRMVLLVQKEVADRITAKDGKESLLSISVKAYGEPKYIDTVKKGSFFPAPNVDSAIILIDKITNLGTRLPSGNEKRFFEVIHAGFAQKRKMILGNLSEIFGGREEAEKKLTKCGINPKSRAEDLKIEDWKCLTSL